MNQMMIRLENNVLKTLTKTLTFVDANAAANTDAEGSTIALRAGCSGKLKTIYKGCHLYKLFLKQLLHITFINCF